MLVAEKRAPQSKCLLKQRLGKRILALDQVHTGEAVHAYGNVEMLFTQRLPPDVERLGKQFLGNAVQTQAAVHDPHGHE